MSPLAELLRKVESAEKPSRELDARIHHALHPSQSVLFDPGCVNPKREASYGQLRNYPIDGWADWDGVALHIGAQRYTASADAALALVERNPIEGQDSVDIVLGALASMVQSASYRPKKPLSDQLARGVIAEYLKALSQKEAGDA